MYTITASHAKTIFGDIILKSQKEPIAITKHGKKVAVIISNEDYHGDQEYKLWALREQIKESKRQFEDGETLSIDEVFKELLSAYGRDNT